MLRMACERYLCQSYNLSVSSRHLVKRGPFLTFLPNFRIYWSGVDQILSLALFRYLLGFYFHMSLKGAMSAGEHVRWGYANYCQNSIAFYASLSLSRPRLRNLQRHLQANWVWIRDILIVFTECFLSVYARSNSLNFFLKNKSVKTNLLVVLK